MNKKRITLLSVCAAVGLILCGAALLIFTDRKAPDAYTWDEYQNMSAKEQDQLFQRFDSTEDFEAWKESVQPQVTEPDFQWNEPEKLPVEHSWEEYSALTEEQKEAFFQWFDSKDAFESWMGDAKPEETTATLPSWEEQEKAPDEYSWDEYQALSPEDQDAFYLWFGSKDAFESWMEAAKPQQTVPAAIWDKPGKTPDRYTFDEYQALTPQEQDLFYQWFSSRDAFEAWLDQATQE
jgi:hypothetical protein